MRMTSSDAFIISIGMPKAAPHLLESQVTTKLERALASIDGIKTLNSSVTDGLSTTIVELEAGADISIAIDEARVAVARLRSNLPADICEPEIKFVPLLANQPITPTLAVPYKN